MELINQSPHKMDCSLSGVTDRNRLTRLGWAFFCPECERRIGFVHPAEHEQMIEDIINNMFGPIE